MEYTKRDAVGLFKFLDEFKDGKIIIDSSNLYYCTDKKSASCACLKIKSAKSYGRT